MKNTFHPYSIEWKSTENEYEVVYFDDYVKFKGDYSECEDYLKRIGQYDSYMKTLH